MKTKHNLIVNLITLSLTTFLLVCIVAAWYVTNIEASCNNIVGSVSDVQNVDINVKTYSLSSSDNSNYEYKIGAEYESEIMIEYGDIDNSITAILVEIEYKFTSETLSSYPLTLETNITEAGCSNEFDSNTNTGTSYLSNATSFYVSTKNEGYIDMGENELNFVDVNTSTKVQSLTIQNISYQEEAGYVYLVMDYNPDLINYLYNDLLQQTTEATLNSKIYFQEDLNIYLRT